MEQNLIDFIKKNDGADTSALLLGKNRYPDIDIHTAVRCIDGRKTIKEKVPQWYLCPSLLYPSHLPLEQCSSQITALHKQKYIPQGAKVADLTGGFGIDTYFISEKASSVDYFERNSELAEIAEHNFKELGKRNITAHSNEITPEFLKTFNENHFDLIYLDPARRGKKGERVFSLEDCEPDLTKIKDLLLHIAPTVVVKLSPMADIATLFEQLTQIKTIDIISVNNECKELLAVMERGFGGTTEIIATDLRYNISFSFTRLLEKESSVQFADPQRLSGYIYEPNASILKGGAFKFVSEHFGVEKLSHDTHFYISHTRVENFPGKESEILEVIPFSKKNIKILVSRYNECSIMARNFPVKTEELKKMVKCTESKEIKGLFTTLADKSKVIIVYRRLFKE